PLRCRLLARGAADVSRHPGIDDVVYVVQLGRTHQESGLREDRCALTSMRDRVRLAHKGSSSGVRCLLLNRCLQIVFGRESIAASAENAGSPGEWGTFKS